MFVKENPGRKKNPNAQFKIDGYKSFRKVRDVFGGGLLSYVNEKLNCRSLEICLPNTFIEILPLELRLLNSKWLILGTYKHFVTGRL